MPLNNLDNTWEIIRDTTEKGLLSTAAKTATSKPNSNATNLNIKVICVYTYDWKDEKDVMRVREEFRKLSITKKFHIDLTRIVLAESTKYSAIQK